MEPHCLPHLYHEVISRVRCWNKEANCKSNSPGSPFLVREKLGSIQWLPTCRGKGELEDITSRWVDRRAGQVCRVWAGQVCAGGDPERIGVEF